VQIKRQELVKVLELVRPAISKREIVEQSASVVFDGESALSYNDELAVRAPFKSDFKAAVQAEPLLKLMQRLSAEDITLTIEEDTLRISTKRTSAGIKMDDEINQGYQQVGNPEKWTPIEGNLIKAIRSTLFSASSDSARPVLTCIHIGSRKTNSYVESTDGFRLTRNRFTKAVLFRDKPDGILIPAKSAKELCGYKPTHFWYTEGWMHFKCETGEVFACRTFAEKFPDCDKVLDFEGSKIDLPESIIEALERAAVFTAEEELQQDQKVTMTVKEGSLLLKGEGPNGWFKEKLKVEHKGDPFTFTIHTHFLMESPGLIKDVTIGQDRMLMKEKGLRHVMRLQIAESK